MQMPGKNFLPLKRKVYSAADYRVKRAAMHELLTCLCPPVSAIFASCFLETIAAFNCQTAWIHDEWLTS